MPLYYIPMEYKESKKSGVRWISERNRNTNKQAYCIQLSYFYNMKIVKLYVRSLLILVTISIGNPPVSCICKLQCMEPIFNRPMKYGFQAVHQNINDDKITHGYAFLCYCSKFMCLLPIVYLEFSNKSFFFLEEEVEGKKSSVSE